MQDQGDLSPKRPTHLSELAELCVRTLAEHGLSDSISIGDALGLLHYLDYRTTHDVDAWWSDTATTETQRQVLAVIEAALQPFGETRRRAWGDVVSLELAQQGKVTFSFQVAQRSAQLKPPVLLEWVDAQVDSLDDLIASKMVALVERGAPRDFRDIFEVCRSGLATAGRCWQLWGQRQEMAGGDVDLARAHLAIETHLERIARHRPIDQIGDPMQRAEAEELRSWFATEFLDARMD